MLTQASKNSKIDQSHYPTSTYCLTKSSLDLEERIKTIFIEKRCSLDENSILSKNGSSIKRISHDFFTFLQNENLLQLSDMPKLFKLCEKLEVELCIADSLSPMDRNSKNIISAMVYRKLQRLHNSCIEHDESSGLFKIKVSIPFHTALFSLESCGIFFQIISFKKIISKFHWNNYELPIVAAYFQHSDMQNKFSSTFQPLLKARHIPIQEALSIYDAVSTEGEYRKSLEVWITQYITQLFSGKLSLEEKELFSKTLSENNFSLMTFILKLFLTDTLSLKEFIDMLSKNLDLTSNGIDKNSLIEKYSSVNFQKKSEALSSRSLYTFSSANKETEKKKCIQNIQNFLKNNSAISAYEYIYNKIPENLKEDQDILLAFLGKNEFCRNNFNPQADFAYTSREESRYIFDPVELSKKQFQEENIYKKYIPNSLQKDLEFNLRVVRQNRYLYKDLSIEFRKDPEIIRAQLQHALLEIDGNIVSIDSELFRDFIKKYDLSSIENFSNIMNEDFILNILEKNPKIFPLLNKDMRNRERFISQALQKNPRISFYLSEFLKNNETHVITNLQKNPILYSFLPDDFYLSDDILLENLKKDPSIFTYFSQEVRNKFKPALDLNKPQNSLSEKVQNDPGVIDIIKRWSNTTFLTQASEIGTLLA